MTVPADSLNELTLGRSGEFMRSLWRFNHALERVSRRMEELRGVTIQQRLFLRFVGKYPGATASQLAAYFHLDPGTISASIARLEHKGLLSRGRTNRDRRRVVLGLTAAGRVLDGETTSRVDGAIEALIGGPSAETGVDARSTLENMTARLEAALD
jgi:DNA-binding MarR family transcriptional regulator